MSLGRLIATRNLFVNTDSATIGECRNATFNLPQGLIQCHENQHMRLTLNSFAMRNSWYRVNKFNNTFFVVAKTTANAIIKAKVEIVAGNYTSFDGTNGLGAAIKDAMDGALNGDPFKLKAKSSTVAWDAVTNKYTFTIDLTGADAGAPVLSELKLVTFTINNYNTSAGSLIQTIIGSDLEAAFSNTFELLGGCYERRNKLEGTDVEQFDQLTTMFTVAGTGGPPLTTFTCTGLFNATLQTEENLYLRTDLHSSSYQTAGFDSGSSLFPSIVSSQILAKIPLNDPVFAYVKETGDNTGEYSYQRPYEVVFYQDNGNNMYSLLLQ